MAKRQSIPIRRTTTTRLSAREVFRQKLAETTQRAARVEELLQQISDLEAEIANRPVIGGVKLTHAECSTRCTTCYLGCAMLPGILAALERDLDRIGGVPRHMLKRDSLAEAGRA